MACHRRHRLLLLVAVHRDLVAYAEILGRGTGQAAPDPAKLIVPMIERFMATDRGLARARRSVEQLSELQKKSSA
ncbi:DUF2274 domain-containing protein [Labrys monachus]|uniref:DUF2274 domain-containing protein n=1 Tax=Labrys monachus TaxID=217067 RepID=UPI0027D83D4D|nr:DUF2274 domain-containing protein [Labrys monachus]